ncbi:YbaK/EbsC family protein [Pseudodesulfovibrio sp.]|uniref:YbaK/EbsC family protein n=1 Tax=Pseudodesulfovibrio sp. TaxID=2035812 RepID=UPI002616D53C|nr:YbaK/EbsC family protein [Pseudodesulfovibrio sp.]MDD3313418.1 YbaK/EbsC family protein [Pseudodesulfovibrio sp.]
MSTSTRTAQEAADSIGCAVAQIAKSLVFEEKGTGRLILVVASGANRVDVRKVGAAMGRSLRQAKGDMVKEKTGFAIGGIPPVAHSKPLPTILDRDLRQYEIIWAAAGTPHAVFQLTPDSLGSLTGGEWMDVREEK